MHFTETACQSKHVSRGNICLSALTDTFSNKISQLNVIPSDEDASGDAPNPRAFDALQSSPEERLIVLRLLCTGC